MRDIFAEIFTWFSRPMLRDMRHSDLHPEELIEMAH